MSCETCGEMGGMAVETRCRVCRKWTPVEWGKLGAPVVCKKCRELDAAFKATDRGAGRGGVR